MAEDNELAIKIRGVKKTFRVYYDKSNSLKERILFWERNRHENRVVLENVDLDIKKGESVGLIGHNGCGKSTLLKLMTKILYPDEGTIEVNGRVSSLLELGAGFHPDLSGRENIYNNASIFGLTKKEIDDRLKEIVDFSELGTFIDNPDFPELNKCLGELADREGVSKSAIAIAWILRHPAKMQAIIGSMNPEHIKDVCDAAKVELSHHDWYALYLASGKYLP